MPKPPIPIIIPARPMLFRNSSLSTGLYTIASLPFENANNVFTGIKHHDAVPRVHCDIFE
jgi:hypothetical protein